MRPLLNDLTGCPVKAFFNTGYGPGPGSNLDSDALRRKAIRQYKAPFKVLKIPEGKRPGPVCVFRQQVRQRITDLGAVLAAGNTQVHIAGYLAIMLHGLHEYQAQIELPFSLAARQLQVLDAKPRIAILRRHDSP